MYFEEYPSVEECGKKAGVGASFNLNNHKGLKLRQTLDSHSLSSCSNSLITFFNKFSMCVITVG